ncbi:MAG TPA: endolytic transglycosylase MltG [Rhodocyclaceae bacterium]|nr:endolytic transglycosylase MltG [Rhodocyclaceae bacterium]
MRFIKRLFLLCFLFVLAVGGLGVWFALTPLQLRTSPLDFTIDSGMSLKKASNAMADVGLGFQGWQFHLFARALQQQSEIKAGSYEVEQGVTPWLLLEKLTRGDVSQGEVMLVEGKTFHQFRALLDASPDLRHDTQGLSDAEVMQRIGAHESSPEGLFMPDTYLFSKQSSDLDVLRRAYHDMNAKYAAEWAKRSPNLPYKTPYDGLIMASIVEKETGSPLDRPMVASVFINRLRQGMMLQTDPSVIYGMGERYDGNIHKADLMADTPYNTYTRTGLPPTPIAMPGLASIRAALNPPTSDKLYFVSRGDGTSQFSSSLDEHNRAVAKYILKKSN